MLSAKTKCACAALSLLLGVSCRTYVPYAAQQVSTPSTAPSIAGTFSARDTDNADAPVEESKLLIAPASHESTPEVVLPESSFRNPMPTALGKSAPAVRYGSLSSRDCRAEVDRRKLAVAPMKSVAKGVASGMRITGPFNEVKVVAPGIGSKFGIIDCRMVLVLDDFTRVLREHGVTSIQIDNVYRPHAKLPGKSKSSQHAFGLALDVTVLRFADGSALEPKDWGATIGDTACGPDAVMAEPTPASVTLRNLMCEVGRQGLFHSILSPSFNAAHQSHFHLDIKRDASSFSLR